MTIEKVNGFYVPSNDIHLEDWKSKKTNFTQNKCLEKLYFLNQDILLLTLIFSIYIFYN